MIKKKICMLGAFAAGKTSLVRQFAHGVFSEKYHTTVGVRIEKKTVSVEDEPVDLIIWDLHGEDEFQKVRVSYLKGAAACVYVVDGTREETLDVAMDLRARAEERFPGLPSLFLVNKTDLNDAWELSASSLGRLTALGLDVHRVSALSADGVEEAFGDLARRLVDD